MRDTHEILRSIASTLRTSSAAGVVAVKAGARRDSTTEETTVDTKLHDWIIGLTALSFGTIALCSFVAMV